MKNISATSGSNNTSLLITDNFPSKAEGIAWCSAFTLEAVFIVVGNLLAIVLFAISKQLRKRSLFFIINMAFADLMLGAVFLPLYIYRLGGKYKLWKSTSYRSLYLFIFEFLPLIEIVSLQASLMSAALISVERFYAIYWPLKHRTQSMRKYPAAVLSVWTFATLNGTILLVVPFKEHVIYFVQLLYALIVLFILCGVNIGIWRKCHHVTIASQQPNRASQNQRLTKTLLFVSTVAVLSWLPLIVVFFIINIYNAPILRNTLRRMATLLCYCNSFVNPIVYVLRIPEFRQALGSRCSRRQAAMDNKVKGRDNMAVSLTPVTQLRTLPTDPSHP